MTTKPNTNFNVANLDLIWNALSFYREHGIPEGDTDHDNEWGDICTDMAWIAEELGIADEVET